MAARSISCYAPVSIPMPVPSAAAPSSCSRAVRRASRVATASVQCKISRMAFYSPTESTFTRHYREEMEMAFSALDCVLNGDKAIYASTELTSGRRLYDQLRAHTVRTGPELRQLKGNDWFESN